MSAIADLDALRVVGHEHSFIVDSDAYGREGCNCGWRRRGFDDATHEDHLMSALIASGAVIDAATLVDDEAGLATVLAKRHKCLDHNGPGSGPCRTDRERAALIAQWIRDRAAALSERADA